MGLASFNRMRRARREVEKLEAERFKADNEARWAAHHGKDKSNKESLDKVDAIREAETAAMEKVGEMNRAGMEPGADDLPMRKEHAAEIAGRNVSNNQEPKDPVARVDERIPDGTVNEELVEHMKVSDPGPSTELVQAAAREAGVVPASERRTPDAPADADATDGSDGTAEGSDAPGTDGSDGSDGDGSEGTADTSPEKETAEMRASLEIPENWQDMPWTERRSLASKLSDTPVSNKDEVAAAIEAELARRAEK